MSGRRNPFKEIEEMMNRMSRQVEESMGGSGMSELTGGRGGAAVDVADRGDELVVTADLPGYTKEDIDVMLRGETLQIQAEKSEGSEEGDGDDGRYIRKERRHQSVSRSVTLPEEVDEENVSAQFQNGVLTVTLPKMGAQEGESHRIDIS
ncbi:Hsp20/alpha crystallin family protein [Halorussus sp. MSC15.2]|uniref:Hsp20/alpha crystallin family protein n=1 Tax=Halorussus sp. MSC15.2 TaxID=2283638 RepID=UPI0013D573E4|nr:Hsp20/alpha crystallin family protein [Halorussus sp. MSC15.2]NEU58553.1 Hsp20/alpha crystallin family protein [Halorussus sp. MSC15.2]